MKIEQSADKLELLTTGFQGLQSLQIGIGGHRVQKDEMEPLGCKSTTDVFGDGMRVLLTLFKHIINKGIDGFLRIFGNGRSTGECGEIV